MPMTVLDPRDLARLASEAQSVDAMRDYVTRYQRLLEKRVSRIIEALALGDTDDAMDAVLSLQASSAMVGACETTELAQELKQALRASDLPRARATASLLPQATRRLDDRLAEFLADTESGYGASIR